MTIYPWNNKENPRFIRLGLDTEREFGHIIKQLITHHFPPYRVRITVFVPKPHILGQMCHT